MEIQIQGGGTLSVNDAVFARPYTEDLVHQVVTAYLAGARSGTKAQKSRGEVRGSTRKLFKQKGTGNARAGNLRTPIRVGGGRAFPAKPRDHGQKVNRKMYRAGLSTILSELLRQGRIRVVEDFDVAEPKTRALVAKLAEMSLKNALIVSEEPSENLYLAARNLPGMGILDAVALDPVSLVRADTIIMTKASLEKIEEWLA